MLILGRGIVVAVHIGGYERDLEAMMFGPEAIAVAIANISSLVLPWITYAVFRKRHAAKP